MWVHIHTYVGTHAYMNVGTYTYICGYTYIHECGYIYTHINICGYAYMCAEMDESVMDTEKRASSKFHEERGKQDKLLRHLQHKCQEQVWVCGFVLWVGVCVYVPTVGVGV